MFFFCICKYFFLFFVSTIFIFGKYFSPENQLFMHIIQQFQLLRYFWASRCRWSACGTFRNRKKTKVRQRKQILFSICKYVFYFCKYYFYFLQVLFLLKKSMFYVYFSKCSTAASFVSVSGTPGAPAPRFFEREKNESSREKNEYFFHLQVLFLFFASTIFIFCK